VLDLASAYPTYGTSALWRSWIDRCRARAERPLLEEQPASLTEVRNGLGVTQAALAERIGMTQSDLSKLERRGDVRVSTLRTYVAGLQGELRLVFERGDLTRDIVVGRRSKP
jgi:predicted transcriptional regulator